MFAVGQNVWVRQFDSDDRPFWTEGVITQAYTGSWDSNSYNVWLITEDKLFNIEEFNFRPYFLNANRIGVR